MVEKGIVLGHRISQKGIEVDKAKIETIEKLPPPISVKGIRSFLGHAGFYRRFIKDFSKIAKPLCNLLEKDVSFNFTKECQEAFEILKQKLISAPIIVTPDWILTPAKHSRLKTNVSSIIGENRWSDKKKVSHFQIQHNVREVTSG